jgi:hypothetical protein
MAGRERLSRVRTIRMGRGVDTANKKEEKDWLYKLESWSKIVSSLAIPLVLAVVGWRVQSSVASEGIKKDYVNMAIAILKDGKVVDSDLRVWAMNIVEKNAPETLSKSLQTKIVAGALQSVPSITWMNPPETLMKPPAAPERIPIEKINAGNITDRDLAIGWANAYRDAKINEITLKYLQKWILASQKLESDFKNGRIQDATGQIVSEIGEERKKSGRTD